MTSTEEKKEISSFENSDSINLRELFDIYLRDWKWFAIGVIISLLGAFLYLRFTSPLYNATAYIMIKDNKMSGISDELKAVSDLGIVGTSSTNNPANEIFIVKSRKIVGRMVEALELTVRYFIEGNIKKVELYKNTPITLDFISKDAFFDEIDTTFIVVQTPKKTLQLKDTEGELIQEVQFNEIITSEKLGEFKIVPNESNNEFSEGLQEVFVIIKPKKDAIDAYKERIQVTAIDENSSVLSLSVSDRIKLKAENMLDELIEQYNLDAVTDKNMVSNKTKDFIEGRLQGVGLQLAGIQDSLKNYKTEFGISGYSKEGEIAISMLSENNKKIIQLETQLSLINWVQQEIDKSADKLEILPANLGFSDVITSAAIQEYNQLVLEKNRLESNAGDKNPNLLTLTNTIKALRQNLQSNLNNLKKSIEIQIKEATDEMYKVQNQIATFPLIERGLIDTQRQKIIYSELYSYLLKKKEELAISLAITVPNAKIIDVAYGSDIPVSPKKSLVYLISLLIGLLVPFGFIYGKNELDTKIHYRKDIEKVLKIPYLGDIPHATSEGKLIIQKDTRTSTAEAFRLLRTNLNFMLPDAANSAEGKVIFVTSTISGEGKSFVSINLAVTLSLINKKVLLIGLDLRAPKITEYLGISNKKGVTNFILDGSLTVDAIKFKLPEMENVDFICSGLIPPNPAELLLNVRVKQLFESVKKDYDYIIADTAPVSLVSDTLMIADYADVFLYVARANHLDKRMLIVPETLYKEKKLPNMAILLNDTDSKRGYGYGYGYVEQEKKPRIKNFLGL